MRLHRASNSLGRQGLGLMATGAVSILSEEERSMLPEHARRSVKPFASRLTAQEFESQTAQRVAAARCLSTRVGTVALVVVSMRLTM
eukprot:2345431-Pyramimonas_sp.AAC.1